MISRDSNSGVKLHGVYEVQIADTWKVAHPTGNDCGGIYPRAELEFRPLKYYHIDEGISPRLNAAKAPGQWQTLDIVFRAPRFDKDGKKIANARFEKVVLNGRLIHDDVEAAHPTGNVWRDPEHATGPLLLQADHGPVAFRHVRVRPLPEKGKGEIHVTARLQMKVSRLSIMGVMIMASLVSSGNCEEPVPSVLKGGFQSFETPLPASADAWDEQKPALRKKLWRLLGDLPPLFTPKVTIRKKEVRDGYTREYFTFDNGVGDTVVRIPADSRRREGARAGHPVQSLPRRRLHTRQGRTLPSGLRRDGKQNAGHRPRVGPGGLRRLLHRRLLLRRATLPRPRRQARRRRGNRSGRCQRRFSGKGARCGA